MLTEKESELVVMLETNPSKTDPEKILRGIGIITSNAKLMSIEDVPNYCAFIPQHIRSKDKSGNYPDFLRKYIDYLRTCVENHGLTENGTFDAHARLFIGILESEEHQALLRNPFIKDSYDVVKTHMAERKHSVDYERHLHYLYGKLKGFMPLATSPQ